MEAGYRSDFGGRSERVGGRSTLGVLYVDDPEADEVSLAERIPITPLVAFCYMLFVLIYFSMYCGIGSYQTGIRKLEMGAFCSLLYYSIGMDCVIYCLSDWRVVCMNNWQEWVVGYWLYSVLSDWYMVFILFRRTRDSGNPCDSCVSGCELKDMMEKKERSAG